MDLESAGDAPRSAVVVGAGVLGLSTAWFLQERGVAVTVVDRTGVGGGSSWGNAGWLSPGLTIPLNEPSALRYGLRSVLDRQAPLQLPTPVQPRLWAFVLQFAMHCTSPAWRRAVQSNLPLNAACLQAYDQLASGGVRTDAMQASITAVFATTAQAARLRSELDQMNTAGLPVSYAELSGDRVRDAFPQATSGIAAGIRVDGQRFVDPGAFVTSLARSVQDRGGIIRSGFEVVGATRRTHAVRVRSRWGESIDADVAVIATGAWFGQLGRRLGVRAPVGAGRGYSFTVPLDEPVPGPLYLPEARVACTPYRGALRVAGTMEFRDPDAALNPARIDAIIASVRPYLTGVRWHERTDEWVGPRPVTPDGRPMIGAVHRRGLYVAAGHGMWGLTQGPISGRLLAEQITTGTQPEELRGCDPIQPESSGSRRRRSHGQHQPRSRVGQRSTAGPG